MRTAEDYLPLARHLAQGRLVHVMDRRGRGGSGPQGARYNVDRECEDVFAVQADTGATVIFGHSYGGLVALESAKRDSTFDRIVLYEPAVSIGGSVPTAWIPRYRQLLAKGDQYGAFTWFIQQSGHLPPSVSKAPAWYLRTALRLVLRGPKWQRMAPLLETNASEHDQIRLLDDTAHSYSAIDADVQLLGGTKSPSFSATLPLDALHHVLPRSRVHLIEGLNHNAPDEKAPEQIAEHILAFLNRP